MGSSGLADDGDGCAGVLQGWGYRSAVACSSRFRWNCSGGGHCWGTRLDRLVDIQVCRRCPGRRLRDRCALVSACCPGDGAEVLAGSRQKPAAPWVGGGRRRRWLPTSFIGEPWYVVGFGAGTAVHRGRSLGWKSSPRTGMFVAMSLPLVSHGNAFSDRFRASDDL